MGESHRDLSRNVEGDSGYPETIPGTTKASQMFVLLTDGLTSLPLKILVQNLPRQVALRFELEKQDLGRMHVP